MGKVSPLLPCEVAVSRYLQSGSRLLILGFNATLTEPVETPGMRGVDQIREMELKLHPELKEALKTLCNDAKTTVIVVSGSDRNILDNNFQDYDMWLAAENGMFLRPTTGEWRTIMPEHLNKCLQNLQDYNSVKDVFEYFTERTPRSHFEVREISLVWNYKYSDVEFGRLQARGFWQHLSTGPISSVADVIQGSRSIEVRSVGVTKGVAVESILLEIVRRKKIITSIDYVLCIGHFLGKDEDIFTYFEPKPPADNTSTSQSPGKTHAASSGKTHATSPGKTHAASPGRTHVASPVRAHATSPEVQSILNLKDDNYFSVTVGRQHSKARYALSSADDVISFLKKLATTPAA